MDVPPARGSERCAGEAAPQPALWWAVARAGQSPVCCLLKKINLCSWSQIRHRHVWQNKVTIIIFKGKNKWLKITSRFTSQILNFEFHPFCILCFKASDLTSPPPQELYLLLLWNLAQITLFSGLTWSCYKKIFTRFVSFPVAHLISPVLRWMSFKHNPTVLNSSFFSCSPLGLLSLHRFPILPLLSFLVCYEQTANLKVYSHTSLRFYLTTDIATKYMFPPR